MLEEQRIGRFNLYDIFANFLPGAILLIGIFLPIVGVRGLLVELQLGSVIVLLVLSFAAGIALQVLGSTLGSASEPFRMHMKAVTEFHENQESSGVDEKAVAPRSSEIEISGLDVLFFEECRKEFHLSAQFEDWERLFKNVLSKLEEHPQSRAIRLHAQYLGVRGMTITMGVLSIYYLAVSIPLLLAAVVYVQERPNWIQSYTEVIHLPLPAILLITIFSIILTYLFHKRQKEFKLDVIRYMIREYCKAADIEENE